MMKAIDVSNHNWLSNGTFNSNTESGYRDSKAVIIKATEGIGFVDPYCDLTVMRCKRDKKLWGFYHYARGNDAVSEADYFYKNCKNYFGEGIPVLDFEGGNNAAWNDFSWALKFVNRIYELSHVWCMIYIQASAINRVANCANNCALWVAGYPIADNNSWNIPPFNYNINPWKTYTVWQFTSGSNTLPLDRNICNIDADGWKRIAKGSRVNTTVNKPVDKSPDYEAMANDVIAGKYGDGEERRRRLGVHYDHVQAIVNNKLSVNHSTRYHIVRAGETLSGIFGSDWKRVAQLNNLSNPNLIYPGQRIYY